jgi:hypothetical protein
MFESECEPMGWASGWSQVLADILVSFDMISLFIKVPLKDTLQLLLQHFDNQTITLIRQVLTTTSFLYNAFFYNQRDGVAVGLPLTPATANFHMAFLNSKP